MSVHLTWYGVLALTVYSQEYTRDISYVCTLGIADTIGSSCPSLYVSCFAGTGENNESRILAETEHMFVLEVSLPIQGAFMKRLHCMDVIITTLYRLELAIAVCVCCAGHQCSCHLSSGPQASDPRGSQDLRHFSQKGVYMWGWGWGHSRL